MKCNLQQWIIAQQSHKMQRKKLQKNKIEMHVNKITKDGVVLKNEVIEREMSRLES